MLMSYKHNTDVLAQYTVFLFTNPAVIVHQEQGIQIKFSYISIFLPAKCSTIHQLILSVSHLEFFG